MEDFDNEGHSADGSNCLLMGFGDGSQPSPEAKQMCSGGNFASVHGRKLLSSRPKDKTYLVIDTNICLKQLDLLEHDCEALRDVIIPQTVAEEVRHRNLAAWSRLRALLNSQSRRFIFFPNTCHSQAYIAKQPHESANDYNDRCIRQVCVYYNKCVRKFGLNTVLLSDDRECRNRAVEQGIEVCSSSMFVRRHKSAHPRLNDLWVGGHDSEGGNEISAQGVAASIHARSSHQGATTAGSSARPDSRFQPHYHAESLEVGIRSGALLAGTFRVNRECWFEGKVAARVAAVPRPGVSKLPSSGIGAGRNASLGNVTSMGHKLVQAWHTSRQSRPSSESSSDKKESPSTMQVLVQGARDVNRATDGDQVVVQLLPVDQWKQPSRRLAVAPATGIEQAGANAEEGSQRGTTQSDMTMSVRCMADAMRSGLVPTGVVVGISRRGWRPLCGSIEEAHTATDGGGAVQDGATASLVFVPVDPRFPRAKLRTTQGASLSGKRILIGLDGWKVTSAFPDAHLIRVIGNTGERATETEVLLIEHDIPSNDFSAEVMACLPPPTWSADEEFPKEATKGRVDCRELTVCSIDPPGCKDIDDALHARELWLTERELEAGCNAAEPTVQHWRPYCAQQQRGEWATIDDRDACRMPASRIPLANRSDVLLNGDEMLFRYLELGVHIADVTHFVEHGTPIDEEAARRGNTTYLTERRLDMLPKLLTETLCSLRDDGPRFAFSVTWLASATPKTDAVAASASSVGVDPDTELSELSYSVVRTCFHKSLVLSKSAMTYQQAYDRLIAERSRIRRDRQQPKASARGPNRKPEKLDQSISWIADVARYLRRQRIEAGALTLASPEVRFLLDSETHEPITVQAYQHKETNRTVEEFMLWANISVAARTTEVYPRCAVLRRHPAPQPGAFDGLVAAAKSVGLELHTSSSKALASSLDAAVSKENPWLNKILRILATRCMQQAVYFPSGECAPAQYLHYGLATPIYTHFTSPIRRYADVMVHRLLAGCIEQGILPHEYEDKQWMRRVTGNLNTRHYNSQIAGRASAALFTQIFFAGKPRVEDALILRIKRNGIVVLVPSYGLEGTVLLVCPKKLRGTDSAKSWAVSSEEELELSEDSTSLSFTSTGAFGQSPMTLKLFDKVRILLSVEERDRARQRHELMYRLVDPPFHLVSSEGEGPIGDKRSADDIASEIAQGTDIVPADSGGRGSAKPRQSKRRRKTT